MDYRPEAFMSKNFNKWVPWCSFALLIIGAIASSVDIAGIVDCQETKEKSDVSSCTVPNNSLGWIFGINVFLLLVYAFCIVVHCWMLWHIFQGDAAETIKKSRVPGVSYLHTTMRDWPLAVVIIAVVASFISAVCGFLVSTYCNDAAAYVNITSGISIGAIIMIGVLYAAFGRQVKAAPTPAAATDTTLTTTNPEAADATDEKKDE